MKFFSSEGLLLSRKLQYSSLDSLLLALMHKASIRRQHVTTAQTRWLLMPP